MNKLLRNISLQVLNKNNLTVELDFAEIFRMALETERSHI